MPLTPGIHLGPFEVLSPLGSGGMGEVYRARDTRIGRSVAIKVLPAALSADPDRKQRLQREARAIGGLSHPHLCVLHDIGEQDGVDFLVMELLDGETLAHRLQRGPLATEEALRYGVEIASGLDHAHRHGVVHRDLKPANIMLTKTGAKVLDFGLAKAPAAGRASDATLSAESAISGTVPYMAPEQIQGSEPDVRSDLFSFGTILYEMLTGRRAFEGSNPATLIGAILTSEPTPAGQSAALERVLRKCLAKEPDRRWQTACDLGDELDWIARGVDESPSALRSTRRRRLVPWIVTAFVLGAAVAGVAIAMRRPPPSAPLPLIRFQPAAPENAWLDRMISRQSLAISSHGGHIAFIASTAGELAIWVHRLDSLLPKRVSGTEGAQTVFWSPDGKFLGFYADGKLKRISPEGGAPLVICDLALAPWSATWGRDGVIIASVPRRQAWRVEVETGAVTVVKSPSFWPRLLPDGKRLISVDVDPRTGRYRAQIESLADGGITPLMESDTRVAYAPPAAVGQPAHLVFGRQGTLMAQVFDLDKVRLIGEPAVIAEQVPYFHATAWSAFDVSLDGTLVYASGKRLSQLTWVDRGGREMATVGATADIWNNLRLSPDGRKVAAEVFDAAKGGADIWIYDLVRNLVERFTVEPGMEAAPAWSPDGSRIAFASAQRSSPELRVKRVGDAGSGSGFAKQAFQLPVDWSPDGRWIAFSTSGGETSAATWVAAADGDHRLIPLLKSEFDNSSAAFSPDGKWIAFSSDESGRGEVYVQGFEGGEVPKVIGPRRRVSANSGMRPRWRGDGRELYFVSQNFDLMAAPVRNAGGSIEFGQPVRLFRLPQQLSYVRAHFSAYDVSKDGQRFLILTQKAPEIAPHTVLVHWQSILNSR